jgi:hypothetical protein
VVAAVGAVAVAGGAHARSGLRPNSPRATTRVSSSRPRWSRSSKRALRPLVEHRAGLVLHALGEADVVVPGVVVGVGDLGPDDFDDARAGFDEAAGEEAALAKGVAAVAVAEFFGFAVEVEGFAGAAGDDEVEAALVVFVEVVGGFDRLLDVGHGGVDGVAQLGAALEAHGEDFGGV